jgi:hypothetical protein
LLDPDIEKGESPNRRRRFSGMDGVACPRARGAKRADQDKAGSDDP